MSIELTFPYTDSSSLTLVVGSNDAGSLDALLNQTLAEVNTSATSASGSASAASASATSASGSASAASASATSASGSASAASASATTADTKANAASQSETNAALSASAAQSAQTASELARDAVAGDRVAVEAARDLVEADRAEVEANKNLTYTYAQDAASAVVYQNLASIAASKAVTAVDVFIYDTSKDSDGGAWRHRCAGTSWYREPLNTASRGPRREFPAVAVIVAETSKVTIYEGDDPALPMWKVIRGATGGGFPFWFRGTGSSFSVSGVFALNGEICFGTKNPQNSQEGLCRVNLISDKLIKHENNLNECGTLPVGLGEYDFSNVPAIVVDGTPSIVSNNVNDVAMTVLPDAPTDPATGLPVPTIAVATAGGVSVITDSGVVRNSAATGAAYRVSIDGTRLNYQQASIGQFASRELVGIGASWTPSTALTASTTPATRQNVSTTSKLANRASGGSAGLTLVSENPTTPSSSMVAYATATYNTGWMPGSIRGAWLSSTDPASLVGGTDSDRSANNVALNVVGTIARTPVATGASLVGYSGFSSSNYLEQPYNSGLDFGTGDFCVMGWIKENPNSALETIIERDSSTTAQRWTLDINPSGFLQWTVDDNTTTRVATSTYVVDNSVWTHFVCTYRAGTLTIYINGVQNASATGSALLTLNNATAVLRHGVSIAGTNPLTNGSLALTRISATAPTADQIRKIYEDEKALFQDGAKCTLFGGSDAVTALAHDPVTKLLHVGTSAGRSDFQGLRRVKNTTVAVDAAISACNGLIVEE